MPLTLWDAGLNVSHPLGYRWSEKSSNSSLGSQFNVAFYSVPNNFGQETRIGESANSVSHSHSLTHSLTLVGDCCVSRREILGESASQSLLVVAMCSLVNVEQKLVATCASREFSDSRLRLMCLWYTNCQEEKSAQTCNWDNCLIKKKITWRGGLVSGVETRETTSCKIILDKK